MSTDLVALSGQMPDLVSRWIADAQVKPSSIGTYKKSLKRMFEFFQSNGITTPTRIDLLAYREYLREKYEATTAGLCLTVARMFFAFLRREEIISSNPAEHIKGFTKSDHHAKSALSPEMVKEILSGIETSTVQGKRDRAIFALMVTTGVRCIEVSRANIEDIEHCEGVVRLHVQGKGRDDKNEAVNVPAGVYRLIKEYLNVREDDFSASSPLFVSRSKNNIFGRMNPQTISYVVKGAMRAAGYDSPRLTAHSLRHTAATTAIKAGVPLREVQQMLRHKDVSVTTIYLHELDEINNQATNINADKFGI